MSLDIDTHKGRITLVQEQRAASILLRSRGYGYIRIPQKTAPFDCFLVYEGMVRAIAETKCRDMSAEKFFKDYAGLWLITYEKLRSGGEMADRIGVPFYGLLYLVPDDLLLAQQIYNPETGKWAPFNVANTLTQRTVNGGQIYRSNAYLDMNSATRLMGS